MHGYHPTATTSTPIGELQPRANSPTTTINGVHTKTVWVPQLGFSVFTIIRKLVASNGRILALRRAEKSCKPGNRRSCKFMARSIYVC